MARAATVTLLPPGHTWEYTFTDPTGDSTWNATTGGWATGRAPFGNDGPGTLFGPGTYWPADAADGDDLWVRTSLDLTGVDLSTVAWGLGVDNGFKLYANGVLIASSNAEGYTFRWEYTRTFGSALVSGVNVIAVALEDHGGATAFDMEITGTPFPTDTEPPVVRAPAPLTVECNSAGGVSSSDPAVQAWLGSASAVDDTDGPLPVSNDLAAGLCDIWTTKTVTFSATDGAGNTGSATSTITVEDTTAPSMVSGTASPSTLWPANHKMVPVTVPVDASDACDESVSCSITGVSSNEPVNGLGDGNTAPDWAITGDLTVDLRAGRSGTGTGRVYTITVTCTDESGDTSTKTVEVKVPHSMGKGKGKGG